MEKTSLSSNVNFAVVLHNGSAGEILTSVNRVTSGSVVETMSVNTRKNSCRSARDQELVRSEVTIKGMVSRKC